MDTWTQSNLICSEKIDREPIFAGVTAYVNIKKISQATQNKIKEMIKAMGGAYSYSFDKNTPHMVHEGKTENAKELKNRSIHIVSPGIK